MLFVSGVSVFTLLCKTTAALKRTECLEVVFQDVTRSITVDNPKCGILNFMGLGLIYIINIKRSFQHLLNSPFKECKLLPS